MTFEQEHGVSKRTREDGAVVFSVDGTHFRLMEAQRRVRNAGHKIIETETLAGGDHYNIIAEKN